MCANLFWWILNITQLDLYCLDDAVESETFIACASLGVQKPQKVHQLFVVVINNQINFFFSLQGAWPWLARLGYYDGHGINYRCAGVLITKQHVMTAAHCVHNRRDLYVVLHLKCKLNL